MLTTIGYFVENTFLVIYTSKKKLTKEEDIKAIKFSELSAIKIFFNFSSHRFLL